MPGCQEQPKGGRSSLFNQNLGKYEVWIETTWVCLYHWWLPKRGCSPKLPGAFSSGARWFGHTARSCKIGCRRGWSHQPGVGEKPALPEGFDRCCLSRCRQHVAKQTLTTLPPSSPPVTSTNPNRNQFEVDRAAGRVPWPTRTLFSHPSRGFEARERFPPQGLLATAEPESPSSTSPPPIEPVSSSGRCCPVRVGPDRPVKRVCSGCVAGSATCFPPVGSHG